ncbi:MAG: 50S ribosomal protein L4 [Flavobacteriales bacterium]|jgi:large subunit ribosomal protein L4|tara:strand:+ start:452 stop:1078 length:627 start_codon:yes stop_codon:yes gene_type:complete
MQVEIYAKDGKKTSKKAKLDQSIFGIEPNDHAIYLDVKRYLASQRQGTNKSKERGEIAGSTRKIKKQKGTGTARAGSIKNPLFKGGGTIFGPKPRTYKVGLNKKVKGLARKSALSYKAKENNIVVMEAVLMDSPKTSVFKAILANMEMVDNKLLFVTPDYNTNLYLSSRNLKKQRVMCADDLSTYDILNCSKLVLLEGSVNKIEETLK